MTTIMNEPPTENSKCINHCHLNFQGKSELNFLSDYNQTLRVIHVGIKTNTRII